MLASENELGSVSSSSIFWEDFVQNWDYFVLKCLLEFPGETIFDWSFLCGKPFTTNYISLINVEYSSGGFFFFF